MYHVVEFSPEGESEDGSMGIVHEKWLTPLKKEAFWPPFKQTTKYNKCLLDGTIPDEKWRLCGIKRTFYTSGL